MNSVAEITELVKSRYYGEYEMNKLVEINGCIEIPADVTTDYVMDRFIEFVECNGWTFGGGFQTIVDDWYVNDNGERIKRVDE